MTAENMPALHYVQSRIYLGLGVESEVRQLANAKLDKFVVICWPAVCEKASPLSRPSTEFVPSSLTDIYRFDAWINAQLQNCSGQVVVHAGVIPHVQVRMCFLLGSHFIMSHGNGFEETFLNFKPLHGLFNRFCTVEGIHSSLCKGWRSLCAAKSINWINFQESPTSPGIDLEEMIHYARYSSNLPGLCTVPRMQLYLVWYS